MEANKLNRVVWTLLTTQTRKRAVASMAFGCVLVGFSFTYYLYNIQDPRPYPLFLVFISSLALAQIVAGTSRLLYNNCTKPARALGLVAIVLLTVFWGFMLAGLIYGL